MVLIREVCLEGCEMVGVDTKDNRMNNHVEIAPKAFEGMQLLPSCLSPTFYVVALAITK